MRYVADCGCIYTGEGRSWCPTCLDGGGVTHMDKQAAALREAVDHIKHLLGEYDENTKSVCKDCRAARAFIEKHQEKKP